MPNPKHIRYSYVMCRPCGCAKFIVADDPTNRKRTERLIALYRDGGLTERRVNSEHARSLVAIKCPHERPRMMYLA